MDCESKSKHDQLTKFEQLISKFESDSRSKQEQLTEFELLISRLESELKTKQEQLNSESKANLKLKQNLNQLEFDYLTLDFDLKMLRNVEKIDELKKLNNIFNSDLDLNLIEDYKSIPYNKFNSLPSKKIIIFDSESFESFKVQLLCHSSFKIKEFNITSIEERFLYDNSIYHDELISFAK